MLRKEMYTWFCVFFYTRQAEADYYVYRHSPPHIPSFHQSTLPPQSAWTCDPSLPPTNILTPPLFGQPVEWPFRPMRTGFKIDLYIFIYAYIKKEWGGTENREWAGAT